MGTAASLVCNSSSRGAGSAALGAWALIEERRGEIGALTSADEDPSSGVLTAGPPIGHVTPYVILA